jgi:hypothetical protein
MGELAKLANSGGVRGSAPIDKGEGAHESPDYHLYEHLDEMEGHPLARIDGDGTCVGKCGGAGGGL